MYHRAYNQNLNENANKLDSGIAKFFGLFPTECFVKEQSMQQFIKPSYEVFQKVKCSNVGRGLLSKLDANMSTEDLAKKCEGSYEYETTNQRPCNRDRQNSNKGSDQLIGQQLN